MMISILLGTNKTNYKQYMLDKIREVLIQVMVFLLYKNSVISK